MAPKGRTWSSAIQRGLWGSPGEEGGCWSGLTAGPDSQTDCFDGAETLNSWIHLRRGGGLGLGELGGQSLRSLQVSAQGGQAKPCSSSPAPAPQTFILQIAGKSLGTSSLGPRRGLCNRSVQAGTWKCGSRESESLCQHLLGCVPAPGEIPTRKADTRFLPQILETQSYYCQTLQAMACRLGSDV